MSDEKGDVNLRVGKSKTVEGRAGLFFFVLNDRVILSLVLNGSPRGTSPRSLSSDPRSPMPGPLPEHGGECGGGSGCDCERGRVRAGSVTAGLL